MSRPLGAKVHYNHNHTPIMMVSPSPCDTTATSTRSSWYDDDDDDNDKNDDLSSSSYSSLVRENIAVPCWGGWLLKLTTHRQQLQQKEPFAALRKPSLKVMTSASSATSDESELGHDDEEEDEHDSASCGSRCMTPPSVSFPNEPCDEMQMIRVLEMEGERFEQQGLLLDALNVYQRLLELLRATGQSANQIGKVHYRTGLIQYQRHYYNEALCHFDQALFIYQLNYDPDHEIEDEEEDGMALDFYRVYVATGHVHLTNQNPYRAIDYFHRALQFVKPEPPVPASSSSSPSSTVSHQRSTLQSYYAHVLQALGLAYEAVGDDTEAKLHYNNAAAVIRTTTRTATSTSNNKNKTS